MDEEKKKADHDNQNQKYSPIWGFVIVTAIVLIFNWLVFPKMVEKQIIGTDYGNFMEKVEAGEVKEVMIEEGKIYFTIEGETDDKNIVYQTGEMNDPDLVNRLLSADSPNEDGKIAFTRVIPRENSPLINFLLLWVLPGVIFYMIFRSLNKRLAAGAKGNFMQFGNSKEAKIYADDKIKTTFADVAGQDEAKEALYEIVDFLHNSKKYTRLGAVLPKGALLVGPPGTGKTLIARAVAGEAKVPFFAMSGSEFVQMFVGMGAAKVRDLFKQANEKAPCIIFIDEIDAIGGRRRDSAYGGNDEREQTLNQLLTEMDGFDATKGVVILAATNRPESLDPALLRPGRFDRRIQMELPDLQARKAILEVHLKKVKHEDVDLDLVARATAGASGADLANIVNEAALLAVRLNKDAVTTSDLEESVEIVIAGAQKKGSVISKEEKEIIAYHEIGHAMVAARQTGSAPVHKITIVPRTSGALGFTMQVDTGEKFLMSRDDMINRITTLTGGRAAEEVVFNTITTGASNDIEKATQIARSMVTKYGMSDKYGMMQLESNENRYLGGNSSLICSETTAADIDKEVMSIISSAQENARQIITDNIDKMHESSRFLLEKETISGEEFMNIINS
ncbi:MAG: ATP-dependent zinc metalloprotease FtsH [Fermentimonas sp.]|nr:ATP-dependent zinc metalloprotease FtsH [Fermentimonas sp.]